MSEEQEIALETALAKDSKLAEEKRALFALRMARKAHDAAWCVASVLVNHRHADGIQQAFFDAHKPKAPKIPAPQTDRALWSALEHADHITPVEALLTAVAPAFFRMRRTQTGARDDDPRFVPAALASPMWRPVFDVATAALALPRQAHFASGGDPAASYASIPTDADRWRGYAGFTLPELIFIAGRNVAFHRPWHLLLYACRTLSQVELVVFAGVSMIVPDVPIPPALATVLPVIRKGLDSEMKPDERRALAVAVRALLDEQPSFDVKHWIRAQELTSARAGFLLAGDLDIASRMLTAEPTVDGAPSTADVLADLASFATSRAYVALRAKLGLAILVGAAG